MGLEPWLIWRLARLTLASIVTALILMTWMLFPLCENCEPDAANPWKTALLVSCGVLLAMVGEAGVAARRHRR